MKILHVYKDFDPPVYGGMEHHMALMCRYQRQWAEVEALTCSRSFWTRRIERDGTPVTEVGEWGRFQSAPLSPLFPYYLRRAQADVVVLHVPNPTAELAYLLMRPKGVLVVRYQSDVVRQRGAMKVYGFALRKLLAKADLILAHSPQYVNTSPYLKPHASRCKVVPLGIIPEEFHKPDGERLRALHEAYGGPYVFFSGKHRYYKGLEFLVRAAVDIQLPVVIAGDGPERARLVALGEGLGVNVVFPGKLSHEELVAHLHGCRVFVFPSVARSEAFGISMLEAAACGKPVVATTLGTGVEHVNVHQETGLNVAPADPEALAEAVNRLLNDDALADALGARGKERVEQDFDVRDVAEKEFALYREVVES